METESQVNHEASPAVVLASLRGSGINGNGKSPLTVVRRPALRSLPSGEVELMETRPLPHYRRLVGVNQLASLRGSGINGNEGDSAGFINPGDSLPSGEVELMETPQVLNNTVLA